MTTLGTRREDAPPAVDLARLVSELGPQVIDIVVAPRGTAAAISGVSLSIPNEPLAIRKGELVLATGVKPGSHRAGMLLNAVAEADATAIAFKMPIGEPPEDLVDKASALGVAVLAVDPELVWTQLYSFVRTVMASSGAGSSSSATIGDLFALANAVASAVGGPVTIEDLRSNVLAYSTLEDEIDEPRRKAILGGRVPLLNQEVLKSAGVFRALWTSNDVIVVDDADVGMPDPMRPRLVIGIRAGEEPLGSIWVQQGDAAFDENAAAALREAARIAALHLVHDRYRDDLARRQRSEAARRLLEGHGPRKDLTPLFEQESQFAVLAIEIESGDPAESVIRRERCLDLVRVYCDAFRQKAYETILDDVVYVTLGLRSTDLAPAYRLAEHVVTHPDNGECDVSAGIGTTVALLRDIPRSRKAAEKTVRVLRSEGGVRRVASIGDVASEAFLLDVRDAIASDPDIRSGLLSSLLAQEGGRNGIYIETLRAYLNHFGDLPRAAASINVHPNTFRYRLKRARETGGLDLEDPQTRLAVELELYWLSQESPEG